MHNWSVPGIPTRKNSSESRERDQYGPSSDVQLAEMNIKGMTFMGFLTDNTERCQNYLPQLGS